jgi:hypothetical protein
LGPDIVKGELRAIKLVQVSGRTRMVLILRKTMRHTETVHGRELRITLSARARPSR